MLPSLRTPPIPQPPPVFPHNRLTTPHSLTSSSGYRITNDTTSCYYSNGSPHTCDASNLTYRVRSRSRLSQTPFPLSYLSTLTVSQLPMGALAIVPPLRSRSRSFPTLNPSPPGHIESTFPLLPRSTPSWIPTFLPVSPSVSASHGPVQSLLSQISMVLLAWLSTQKASTMLEPLGNFRSLC